MQGLWYANHDGNVYVSSKKYAETEIFLANWMRVNNRPDYSIKNIGKGLTATQLAVSQICLENKTSCLSGLPGTGKTYTCGSIAESLMKSGLVVKGCALTGIAASKLQEDAQVESTTIHRMLGYRGPRDGYTIDKVYADAIIVDECSMIDNQLLLSLVSRISKDCRLILVGDPDQLPSIEPSDTFRQLCQVLPHGRLIEILRTEKDSSIGRAAKSILAGSVPTNEDDKNGGTYVIQCDGLGIDSNGRREKNHPLTIAERMANLDKTELRYVRSMACTNDSVNFLNDKFTSFKKLESKHPVMCIINRHDIGIYNGDIGYRVGTKYPTYYFNGEKTYLRQYETTDAWVTTVDKTQGHESISAQCWIEHNISIRRAYTALTRAKRRFCFVGNIELLENRLHSPEEKRITLLAPSITGEARYTDTTG